MPLITDSINVNRDLMYGGRITSEEKSAISTYVGAGIAIVLALVGIYFFFLTQKEKKRPQLSIRTGLFLAMPS